MKFLKSLGKALLIVLSVFTVIMLILATALIHGMLPLVFAVTMLVGMITYLFYKD